MFLSTYVIFLGSPQGCPLPEQWPHHPYPPAAAPGDGSERGDLRAQPCRHRGLPHRDGGRGRLRRLRLLAPHFLRRGRHLIPKTDPRRRDRWRRERSSQCQARVPVTPLRQFTAATAATTTAAGVRSAAALGPLLDIGGASAAVVLLHLRHLHAAAATAAATATAAQGGGGHPAVDSPSSPSPSSTNSIGANEREQVRKKKQVLYRIYYITVRSAAKYVPPFLSLKHWIKG